MNTPVGPTYNLGLTLLILGYLIHQYIMKMIN